MKKLSHKILALLLAGAMTACLAGCGASITGVALELPATMERGSALQATPEYSYSTATPETARAEQLIRDLGVQYTSSAPEVITVDEAGVLTAVGTGTAEISLTDRNGNLTASQTVTVVVTPTDISTADALTLSMAGNTEAELNAVVTPADATDVQVLFTSRDPDIAQVDANGHITAAAAGETVITATIAGTDLTSDCDVTVLPAAEQLAFSDASVTLRPEAGTQLNFTVTPENADLSDAVWASSDESVVSVDQEGNLTALKAGTAEITLAAGDVNAVCQVTVAAPAAASQSQSAAGSSAASGQSSSQSQDEKMANFAANNGVGSSSFDYSAPPFALATDGNWWAIDASDAAYWAVANNINAMRAAAGLPALAVSDSLSSLATSRCGYCADVGYITHDGASTSEILACGYHNAGSACTLWQNSPGHYAALTNASFTQMGIGCYFGIDGMTIWCVTFS